MTARKFIDWIFEPPHPKQYTLIPLTIVAWDLVLSTIIVGALSSNTELLSDVPYIGTEIASWYFPFELIYYAFEEEVIFRIVPIILAMHFFKSRALTLLVVVVSSVIFGFIHGDIGNIFVQGIGGLIYGILFIKYSENGTKYIKAGAIIVLLHIIFNVLDVLTLASFGETVW